MVRQSKISEISLHQDNNKRLNSNLRLAHTGSISIFPTIEGGEYDVTTLQSVLNDPLYVHLQDDTLRVGLDSGDDSNIKSLDFIGLHAKNEILIGTTTDPKNSVDPVDSGFVGTVKFQSDELDIDVNSTNFNIKNDAIFSVAHLSGTNSINIGVDKDTNTISETTTINGDDVKITTPSGIIELNGNQIRMNGNVDIIGEISFADANIVFESGLSVLGGVSIFNLMNGNNDGSKNGIWFDEYGDHALYFADNDGLAPSGDSGDTNGVPVPIYDSGENVKKIRLRTSSGLIFEDSSTNTVFFSLDTTDSSNVSGELIGGLTIGGDINVSGNVTINGDLNGTGISIYNDGTISTTGDIVAQKITTQNVNCKGNLVVIGDITSQSVVLSENIIMRDSSEKEVFKIDSGGNLESSGTIQSTEFVTRSVSIRSELDDSGSEIARFDNNGLSLSGAGATIDSISTKKVTIEDDYGDTRISMDNSGFVSNEDVTINGTTSVDGDLTVNGNINYNNITLTGTLDCNELTANAFHTGDTNGNMEFDTTEGVITAKNMFLSGSLDVNTIRTDATIIDTDGITCQNSVSAKEFHHVSKHLNGNEKHTLIDSSGNLNLPGYISVDGDIETTGGKIIGVDADISGNIEANRIIIKSETAELEIGNGYTFDSNDTGYDAVTIDSTCIISKDASNYSYLKVGEIVCGDDSGNNTKVTSNGIEIRDGSVVTSSILNNGITAQNLTIEDTLTLSGTEPLAVSSEIKIQGMDTNKLVTITPTNLSIENGTSKFNATSSALEFENPVGTRVAKMTTNEIEAPSLITDNLRVNNELTFGDTLVISFPTEQYSMLTFRIDDIVFDSADSADRTPEEGATTEFGPEYNVVIRINKSDSFLACIVLSINFGTLLNSGVDYMCTGKLGDTYLNGSDSVKKITTSDDSTYDSIYQFNYVRNLNEITIGGGEAGVEEDDVPDLGQISYTVHIAKGIGLGFVA